MSEKLFDVKQFAAKARKAVSEGVVLLKNDREALPLAEGMRIALFGRSQFNYYKSGTGSGGMVNTRYVTGVREALLEDGRFPLAEGLKEAYDAWIKDHPYNKGAGWGQEPWFQEEMPVTEELAKAAAAEADAAIVLIGRTAGEDQDNAAKAGSYLLTEDEEEMLKNVCAAFEKTIVLLNTGNIIDMKWVQTYDPAAVAYIWQGGQEGGSGVVDVLSGDVCPSGRLSDTVAFDIADYSSTANFGDPDRNLQQEDIYVGYRYFETFAKDKVLYPFGFGLSYTSFDIRTEAWSVDEDAAEFSVSVTNTGDVAGKEVVQIYVEAPQGALGKPVRALVGFAKTALLEPQETQDLDISIPVYTFASYDDSGCTGHAYAYVLEEGVYRFYVGANVRDAAPAGSYGQEETVVVKQHTQELAPREAFMRMRPKEDGEGGFEIVWEDVPLRAEKEEDMRARQIPAEIAPTGDRGIKLADVLDKKASMEDFIAQLSDEELFAIVRGEGMSSPKVTPGTGGAIGGLSDALAKYGIPMACVTDGPSGIRMDCGTTAFAMPNGTLLACTWNEELSEELYVWEGLELRKNHVDALLGPGMNLHRNPLNGRNFEYFSEDPLLTGKMAAAQLRGMHQYDVTGVIKHFAMNTQETRRRRVNSVASERAIRELYLKGFEIAVKEGGAHAVMSTYGPINGRWTASSFELQTRILRGEWGFDGIVMTDWWADGNDEDGEPAVTKMASLIRAQNDLYMVTVDAWKNTNNDDSAEALAEGKVARAEYQRSAANICKWIMNKPVMARFLGKEDEISRRLDEEMDEEDTAMFDMIRVQLSGADDEIDLSAVSTEAGSSATFMVAPAQRGIYELIFTLRAAGQSDLAQVSMSVFAGKDLLSTVTLKGSDRDWQTVTIPVPNPVMETVYLKLFFAQSGMEIESFKMHMTRDLEEIIRQYQAMNG